MKTTENTCHVGASAASRAVQGVGSGSSRLAKGSYDARTVDSGGGQGRGWVGFVERCQRGVKILVFAKGRPKFGGRGILCEKTSAWLFPRVFDHFSHQKHHFFQFFWFPGPIRQGPIHSRGTRRACLRATQPNFRVPRVFSFRDTRTCRNFSVAVIFRREHSDRQVPRTHHGSDA